MKLLRSLIKCDICNHSYTGYYENNRMKYVCNHYRMGKGCTRRVVSEEELLFIIRSYCKRENIPFEKSNQGLKNIIEKIYIDENCGVVIHYKNNHTSIWNDTTLLI